jgi:hypothetical protein
VPILKGHPVDTSTIPKHWITSTEMYRRLHGPAETIAKAWIDAGRPESFQTFKKGYESAAAELVKTTAGPKELVAELEVHGRLLYIASRVMSTPQRAAYAQQAHKGGDDVGKDYARTNERDALIKRFGGARA